MGRRVKKRCLPASFAFAPREAHHRGSHIQAQAGASLQFALQRGQEPDRDCRVGVTVTRCVGEAGTEALSATGWVCFSTLLRALSPERVPVGRLLRTSHLRGKRATHRGTEISGPTGYRCLCPRRPAVPAGLDPAPRALPGPPSPG